MDMDMDIDVAGHIGATTRAVRDDERDGRPTRVLVAERTFETGIDDLWDALTSAERIPRWFLPITGDLRLGGHYQLEGNAGGTVTTCEAPAHLAVTWEYGGSVSWVDVRLDAAGGERTRLVLEHTAHPDPEWDAQGFGPGAVGIGWDGALLGLALHVGGGTRDPEAVAAWQRSPGGIEFVRRSGDAWCDADVASGTAPDVARAAADRTIEAYTAEG